MAIEDEIAKNARIANMMLSHIEKSDMDVFIPNSYKDARSSALYIINKMSDDLLTTFKYSKKFLSKMSSSDKIKYNEALAKLAMMNRQDIYVPFILKPFKEQKQALERAGIKYERGLLSFISTHYRDLFAVLSYAEIKEKVEQQGQNPNFDALMQDIYTEIGRYKQEELKRLNEKQQANIKRYRGEIFTSKQLNNNPIIANILKGIN